MSKIFLSHSSVNNAQALALACWLQDNGWDEYFLDVEPNRGLVPGERWLAALRQAADRCEAVICLISPAWRNSPHCLTEFLLAQQRGKPIFGVLVESTPLESLPKEMTAEWQLCDLIQGGQRRNFQVFQDPIVPHTDVSFAEAGLTRLKIGLQRAGLDAASFQWPPPDEPKRAPYRGMKPLEAVDAAVFFGRDAAIVRGLDTLRAMQEQGVERMLVILGASGSGKSSFLRAGLWPRLKRDDLHFLPLPVIRPELAVLSGDSGLVASLETAFNDQGIIKTRASLRDKLQTADGLPQLLDELQQQACVRISAGLGIQHESAVPLPTIVIAIDQGEELTNPEGRKEAELFLVMLAKLLSLCDSGHDATKAGLKPPLIVVTIRSDAYERLQTEPSLEGNQPRLFDLPPISPKHYKTVIEGPAARATAAGRKLTIEPELIDQLLQDTSGTDALPLLAFTLERLYVDYGADGDLRLDEYNALGGVRGSIEAAVNVAFAEPGRQPAVPAEEAKRTALLHKAFVPWLAAVDQYTNERRRRVARWDKLHPDTHPLLERLIEARLLLRDRRKLEGEAQEVEEVVVVEITHEALLRQWSVLTEWLDADASKLKTLDGVQRASSEWIQSGRIGSWLVHAGERLTAAEQIRTRDDFNSLLGSDGIAYLKACREKESQVQRALKSRILAIVMSILTLGTAGAFAVIAEGLYWMSNHRYPSQALTLRWKYKLGIGESLPLPKLVKIPAGSFAMGEVGEAISVTIHQPFYLASTETTFAQYDIFQQATGRDAPVEAAWGRGDGQPVINVNWFDARAYAKWLSAMTSKSCRLPSEAEWEYAARGGTGKEYGVPAPDGSDDIAGKGLANCSGCGSQWDGEKIAPAGRFPANRFGLHDMSGNVWEWTCSNWQVQFDGSEQRCNDDATDTQARVLRGGSWYDFPGNARASKRNSRVPAVGDVSLGFRVLCSSPIE